MEWREQKTGKRSSERKVQKKTLEWERSVEREGSERERSGRGAESRCHKNRLER